VASVRVVVVEDHEQFRRFIYSTLEKASELQVVDIASDGLAAVQKAEKLQPDLILLDIGLPTLNGIEAARRIRKLSPQSKIIFVSQESSVDVVRETLATGARGYVVKTDAGRELLTAVEAVLRGEQFVGSRFACTLSEGDPSPSNFAPLQQEVTTRCHEVGFYSDDRCFLDDPTQFIGAALKAGNAAVVVAIESHREGLLPRLRAYGSDIGVAIEQGRYISFDAADALSTFMINGMPDPAQFLNLFGSLILKAADAAKGEPARVAVFGEGVHLLWAQGNAEAVVQVERLTNLIARSYDVDILCGYYPSTVRVGMDSHTFQRICAEHSAVHSR